MRIGPPPTRAGAARSTIQTQTRASWFRAVSMFLEVAHARSARVISSACSRHRRPAEGSHQPQGPHGCRHPPPQPPPCQPPRPQPPPCQPPPCPPQPPPCPPPPCQPASIATGVVVGGCWTGAGSAMAVGAAAMPTATAPAARAGMICLYPNRIAATSSVVCTDPFQGCAAATRCLWG